MDISAIQNLNRRLNWTKEWLKKNQHEFQNKENLRKELMFRSKEKYHLNNFFKITDVQFRYLVNILGSEVTGLKPHRKRKAFSAEERIAITLKYLATGEVNSCRNYCFLAPKPVILKMIADICEKIYELFSGQFVTYPKRKEQWISIMNGMQHKRHLSNCLGHLVMHKITFHTPHQQPAPRTLTKRVNKTDRRDCLQSAPLILTSIIDDKHHFLYVDVEKIEGEHYHEIFEKSTIRKLIEDNTIPIPDGIGKPNCRCEPCGFAGNLCFLKKSYIKSARQPMSKQESNAFQHEANDALRLLCNIFAVFGQPLRLCESEAQKIILGSIALYNFLRKTDSDYCRFTEAVIMDPEADYDVYEDAECVIVENDEERKERYEFMPKIQSSMCFTPLRK